MIAAGYATLERQAAALQRDIRLLRQTTDAATAPRRSGLDLAGDLGIALDPWQRDVVTTTAHHILMLVSRQGGKGTAATILALDALINDPGSTTVVVSRSERQAKRLFRRIRRAYRSLANVPPAIVDTTTELELRNGSEALAVPGSEDTIRGIEGVDLLIIDEASRVPDDLYATVRPMLATTDGRCVALSTPFGKRGFFWREWTEGGTDWHRAKVTAHQIPRIKPSFLERERQSLGDWWYAQEYLCEFKDADDQLYATDLVEGALTSAVMPLALPVFARA